MVTSAAIVPMQCARGARAAQRADIRSVLILVVTLIQKSVLEARRLPLKLTTLRFGSRLHGDADPCAVVASVIERIMILEREICS